MQHVDWELEVTNKIHLVDTSWSLSRESLFATDMLRFWNNRCFNDKDDNGEDKEEIIAHELTKVKCAHLEHKHTNSSVCE